uniref:Uncharacterized protein n=1 Tax=Branchiostoma floridae TaxID=7739 RepID=C3ZI61_BRAFL|eukprot:XP_002591792.1 hypothetical protein BRAFLDRAFT_83580 [Branchiostoma floridae]
MSDKEKAQAGIPRPVRGLPRPTRGLPRPTAQTGARGPAVKIAFGRRLPINKTKPRQVTRDKTVKRLRNNSSSSKESPTAGLGAKRANIDEDKLTGTIVKKSYKLRPKAKNPVNGICTTNFNPKATLNFGALTLTGKKSLPEKQPGVEKENAVLKELNATKKELNKAKEELTVAKEELKAAKEELEAAKASNEKAMDAGMHELEVSLDTWFELKESRDKQRKETTARARAMHEKWKQNREQALETNKQLLELREKLEKISKSVCKSEDKKA